MGHKTGNQVVPLLFTIYIDQIFCDFLLLPVLFYIQENKKDPAAQQPVASRKVLVHKANLECDCMLPRHLNNTADIQQN